MRYATFVALGLALSACSSGHQVASRSFEVPADYQEDWALSWLPEPEADSLSFTLNPAARPQDRVSVLVEPKMRVCGDEPTSFEQPVCKPSTLWKADKWIGPSSLRRFEPSEDGGTQWQYLASQADGQDVVAACFGPVNEHGGLCHTAVRYRDDVFVTLGYPESELPHLRDLIAKAQQFLANWES